MFKYLPASDFGPHKDSDERSGGHRHEKLLISYAPAFDIPCGWNATQKALSGQAIRPVGESGSVFIYGPPKMGVANPKVYYLAEDIENDWLVIRYPLRFDEGWAEWNVKFFNF